MSREEPKPLHVWNDPDGDGHNCADCGPESIWKCDAAAHFPADAYGLLTSEERAALDESLAEDRRTRKEARIAAGRMPLP